MGCSVSQHKRSAPPVAAVAASPPVRALSSHKWSVLQEWTDWHQVDQFGWAQPSLSDIVGTNGRSRLGGQERVHNYQVAISFPGADFDKGSEGHRGDITDSSGAALASSGTELAEALQQWIVTRHLGGNQQAGLSHVFVCSKNLRYTPGSVKAHSFRHLQWLEQAESETSTAVLNENWGMYLRESFVEARVIVFVINEDWVDSIPCNQEFEALLVRKRGFGNPDGQANGIIFFDITDKKYNERYGGKLPQLKEGMCYEARRAGFDVHNFVYNQQCTPEQKLAVEHEFLELVGRYMVQHPLPLLPPAELQDYTATACEVHWPTWLYYHALEGKGGWQSIVELHHRPMPDGHRTGLGMSRFDLAEPDIVAASSLITSRRFRIRFMGVQGDTFNEGFKFMCHPIQLLDAAGTNIVAPGKGYFKMAGERMGTLGMSHWVGPRQYSWVEWLVPDDAPPVVIKSVDVRVGAHHCVVEAMPLSSWPSHGSLINDGFTFLDRSSTAGGVDSKPAKWIKLHEVSAAGVGAHFSLAGAAPACTAFRLRIRELCTPGVPVCSARVTLTATLPAGLSVLSGGMADGSGGNCEMEDATPDMAFDGDENTRWVDIGGGGIGNTSWLMYTHPEPMTVVQYKISSQAYALTSYHSHLNGSPRDWVLSALDEDTGHWHVLDQRKLVYYSNHGEIRQFSVASPRQARQYRLVFSAVAAGCATRSIQVGGVQLLAVLPARSARLQSSQLILHASSLATGPNTGPALVQGLYWSQPDVMELSLPVHSEHQQPPMRLAAVRGGTLSWTIGEGRVSNWYDHPLSFPLQPIVLEGSPDRPVKIEPALLVVRPRKEVKLVDGVFNVTFRQAYPDGEVELVYTHAEPFILKAYSIRSGTGYPRGDPRSWILQAQDLDGSWATVHAVDKWSFPDRDAMASFQCLSNTAVAHVHRLVITEMNAMVGLLHFSDFILYKLDDGGDDCVPVQFPDVAHVTIKLKPREGAVRLNAYSVESSNTAGESGARTTPCGWVLEGWTSEYDR